MPQFPPITISEGVCNDHSRIQFYQDAHRAEGRGERQDQHQEQCGGQVRGEVQPFPWRGQPGRPALHL